MDLDQQPVEGWFVRIQFYGPAAPVDGSLQVSHKEAGTGHLIAVPAIHACNLHGPEQAGFRMFRIG